jgi:hypothetical protein
MFPLMTFASRFPSLYVVVFTLLCPSNSWTVRMPYPFKSRLGDNVWRVHHRCRRLATVVPVVVTPFGDPPTGVGEAPKGEVDRRKASAVGDTSRRVAERLRQTPTASDEAPKR